MSDELDGLAVCRGLAMAVALFTGAYAAAFFAYYFSRCGL